MSAQCINNNTRDWTISEFSDIDLGDKRLNDRLIKTAQKLSEQPMAPINKACESWKDTKGAYRLFYNDLVTPKKILLPHKNNLTERAKNHSLIFAVQDTTYVNFDTHVKTKGLGNVGGTKNKEIMGLIMHNTLAVTLEGLPLGLLDQKIYSRAELPPKVKKPYHKCQAIQDKESYRWIESLQNYSKILDTEVVTIGDRELDIYEFFVEAEKLHCNFLIRSSWNRILKTNKKKYEEQEKIWDHVIQTEERGLTTIKIPQNGDRASRDATVSIKFDLVELKPPQRYAASREKNGKLPPISIYAIYVREQNPPENEEPVEWMLLTNVITENITDAIEKIKWYKLRWHVENFHKVLKSGCKIEDCRLGEVNRIKRFLTLMSIIAWRLYLLTHINRVRPDEKCSEVLNDHEWKALYCKINKTNILPLEIPTIRQVIRWIAQLGGFLSRKNDGEPGITTIWRGWQRLHDISEDYLLFKRE